MSFIYGLNIANALQDVDSATESLANLGFRRNDLNLLKGVGLEEVIRINELHLVSGLTDNQDTILGGMIGSSDSVNTLIAAVPDASAPSGQTPVLQNYNYNLNDRLVSGAIKYNFTDYNESTSTTIAGGIASVAGNIVTSSDIFIDSGNNEVNVSVGDKLVIGGNSGLTEGDYTVLDITSNTSPKAFRISASAYSGTLTNLSGATFTLVKYWDVKQADISTSRVSSWSPIGDPVPDSHILYGGQLKNNGTFLSVSSLALTTAPIPKQFRSEQATHIVELYINGAYRKVPAVKGIGFSILLGSFSGAPDIRVGVSQVGGQFLSDSDGDIPITMTRTFNQGEADEQTVIVNSPPQIAGETDDDSLETGLFGQYISAGPQDTSIFKIFYIPTRIKYLKLDSLALSQYTVPTLTNLTSLNIDNNLIQELPTFTTSAPSLIRLRARYNSFYTEVETTSITYSDMISRIPSTVNFLDLMGSIRGTSAANLDFSAFPLEVLKLGTDSSDDSSRFIGNSNDTSQTSTFGLFPKVISPNLRVEFNPATQPSSFANNGLITVANHGLQNGDYVQYWARVDSSNTLGTGTGLTSASAIPGANNASSIYEVYNASTNSFQVKTYPGGSNVTSFSGTITGTFHEFVKVNTDGSLHLESNTGIKNYTVKHTGYTALPNGVSTSDRLETFDVFGSRIRTGEYQNRDTNNQEESDWQASVSLNTTSLKSLQLHRSFCNIPNVSNNSSLTTINLVNVDCAEAIVTPALRTIDASLFNNLPNLKTFKMNDIGNGFNASDSLNFKGDLSQVMRDKKSLETLEILDATNIAFRMNDNAFKSGSVATTPTNLINFRWRSRDADIDAPSSFDDDFFGVNGQSNRTGQVFSNFGSSLKNLTVDTKLYQGGRLYNDDDAQNNNIYQLSLTNLGSLEQVSITGHFVGKMPSIQNLASATTVSLFGTRKSVPIQSMKNGGIYVLQEADYGNAAGQSLDLANGNPSQRIVRFEWEDMGWMPNQTTATARGLSGVGSNNAEVVDTMIESGAYNWESTTEHGDTPSIGDYFIFKDLTVNEVAQGFEYVIKDLGNTTTANWTTLGWVANSTTFNTGATPAVGDRFIGSSSANTVFPTSVQQDFKYRVMKHYTPIPSLLWSQWTAVGAPSLVGNGEGTEFVASSNGNSTFVSISQLYGLFGRKIAKTAGDSGNMANGPTAFGTGTVTRAARRATVDSVGLYGAVPPLTGFTSLNSLILNNNSLTGQFPSLTAGSNFELLELSNNRLHGSVPDLSNCNRVKQVKLQNNFLNNYNSGSISLCTRLQQLDLGNNRFPAATSKGDPAWNMSVNLLNDILTMIDGRTNLTGHTINLVSTFSGLNETQFEDPSINSAGLDPDASNENSPKSVIASIRASGFQLNMNS